MKSGHAPGTKRAPRWFRRLRKKAKDVRLKRKRIERRRENFSIKIAARRAVDRAREIMAGRGAR